MIQEIRYFSAAAMSDMGSTVCLRVEMKSEMDFAANGTNLYEIFFVQ